MRFWGTPTPSQSDALEISRLAIEGKAEDLGEFLKDLAGHFKAFGAVIFELAGPEISQSSQFNNQHRLFSMASWFDTEEEFTHHSLGLEGTISGQVMKTEQPAMSLELSRIWAPFLEHPLFRRHDIQQVISVPLFQREGEIICKFRTLNLYRRSKDEQFLDEMQRLAHAASVINPVIDLIEERRSLKTMLEIDQQLLPAVTETPSNLEATTEGRIESCCQKLKSSFDCCEVSLFLSDSSRSEDYSTVYSSLEKPKSPQPGSGLTGWVLEQKRSIHILDLRSFGEDESWIHEKYPEAQWTDSADLNVFARAELNIHADDPLPPISFMAAPVLANDELFGVLRCSVRYASPSYFSSNDAKLLESIAARIGLVWRDVCLQKTVTASQQIWKHLAGGIQRLSNNLPAEHTTKEYHIRQFLNDVHPILNQASLVDVRLVDSTKRHLEVVAAAGEYWNELSTDHQKSFLSPRYLLDSSAKSEVDSEIVDSLGAKVFNSQQPIHSPSPRKFKSFAQLNFHKVKELIVVPITFRETHFGVLDLHRTGNDPFPQTAVEVGRLLGAQLGLHLQILNAFEKSHQQQWQHHRANQDLSHQLKTPLGQVLKRLDRLLRRRHGKIEKETLIPIRGLARKANSVANSMKILANFHQGKPIAAQMEEVDKAQLQILLSELVSDAQLLVDPEREIQFKVDRESIGWAFFTWSRKLIADLELVRQAISNLLDNAGKYSFKETEVTIDLSTTGKFLLINVSNQGIPMTRFDAQDARDRDWRGPEAQSVTGEGSGIGLWIVDQIMQVHSGELLIRPTNEKGITTVSLKFPGANKGKDE